MKAALAVPVARTGRSGVLDPGQVPAVSIKGHVAMSILDTIQRGEMIYVLPGP